MKIAFFWILLATGLLMLGPCAADPSPISGTLIPIPPQQSAPWTPASTKLPANVVGACQELFDAGLADPRGCEYREIVVPLRAESDFGPVPKADEFETHGWVLPAQAGESRRYAVCWNGLVYPLVSIGASANLDGDIQIIIAQNPAPNPEWQRQDPSMPSPRDSVKFDCFTLVKIPLLLRLGRGDLAEEIWNHEQACIMASRWNEDDLKQTDPFVILSEEWLRSTLDRALDAHMRNDPKLALAFLEPIPGWRKKVEDATERRSAILARTHQDYHPYRWWFDPKVLNQIPALIGEEQRRIKENVTSREEEFAPEKVAVKKERIALLVHDLEDVEAHPMMMPGYVDFGMSPVVQNLVQQGEDAVDPLLDCLEHDHRLTRSIDTGVRVIGS